MTVEVEFNWPLNLGYTVIVEAEGTYYAEDDTVWPITMTFITPPTTNGNAQLLLTSLALEMEAIQEHAALCIAEKARDELKENAS